MPKPVFLRIAPNQVMADVWVAQLLEAGYPADTRQPTYPYPHAGAPVEIWLLDGDILEMPGVRERIVFTTHTPIPAGNEVHPLAELRRLGACCELVDAEMRALGGDPFNMTVAGLRVSRRANAVSAVHADVSRAMWHDVEGASEIIAITNGVHAPTWQDARVREGRGSAEGLWATHQTLKREMREPYWAGREKKI